jgi:Flp pilus assembly protein TadB
MIAVLLATGWVVLVGAWGAAHRPVDRWRHLAPVIRIRTSRSHSLSASRWWSVGTAAVAGAVGLLVLGPIGAPAFVGAVVLARRLRSVRAARREAAERRARLPDAIDLLVVSAAAGLTPRQGILLVAERGPPALRPAFAQVASRMEAGEPLAVALSRLTTTVGEPARGLVQAIVTAERDGAPVRSLLGRLADDARRQRRHDLDAAVRRLPVRLTFPLACCALPAFLLLTVIPLLAAGLRRLGPISL